MKRVYIAGKLSNTASDEVRTPAWVVVDYIKNVNRMCAVAGFLRKQGYAPYVPGLDLLLGVVYGDFNEEDYRGMGMAFLECCDAVLVISYSSGVQREINRAKELGIPVFNRERELLRDMPR